ncbi:MAG: hypothetical protein ACYCW6_14965 [Candidatus Xenobia bacterium]
MPPTTPADRSAGNRPDPTGNDSERNTLWLYVGLLLAFWGLVGVWTMHYSMDDKPYSEFKEQLAASRITDVWLDGRTLYCHYARSEEQFRTELEEPLPQLQKVLNEMHVPLHHGRPPSTTRTPWWLVRIALLGILLAVAYRVFKT